MSSEVPAAVPSVSQSSWPLVASNALNRTWPLLKVVNRLGPEPMRPAKMSLSSRVPAAVPSVTHSSWPLLASNAVNRT
ncbi:hypothetical protein D3C84_1276590 [compost metagenome]